jgi:hypothetical protein
MRGGYVTGWTVAIGVDTHKQWHVAVALDPLGRLIDSITVDATSAGYRRCLVWARSLGEPAFAIEGAAVTARVWPASWPITASRCLSASGPGGVSGVVEE